jgi:hypothetical protein
MREGEKKKKKRRNKKGERLGIDADKTKGARSPHENYNRWFRCDAK